MDDAQLLGIDIVEPAVDRDDQHQPAARVRLGRLGRLALGRRRRVRGGDSPCRREHLLVLGKHDLEGGRQGLARRRSQAADEVLGLPTEELAGEPRKVHKARRLALALTQATTPGGGRHLAPAVGVVVRVVVLFRTRIGERGEEAALELDRAAGGDRLAPDEGGR